MEAKDPEGLANLEPRDMAGMICLGDHQTLIFTKFISCGPYGYELEDFLKFFPIISLCELLIPMCMASFHPRGLIGRIYVGTTRHTKYIISYNGFREYIFMFFPL